MEVDLAFNYKELLSNQIIFIYGMGRSGTTVLGKLLGSLKPSYYFFEPNLFKTAISGITGNAVMSIFFHDYLYPVIWGTQLCTNPSLSTHHMNYWATQPEELKRRKRHIKARKQTIEYLRNERPIIFIKLVNAQKLRPVHEIIAPGSRALHIIRNGLDVISSSVNLSWYTDRYFSNEFAEDYNRKVNGINVPWYIDDETAEHWSGYAPVTRAAHIWRLLTTAMPQSVRYEDLCEKPLKFIEYVCDSMGLEITDLTKIHLESVKKFVSANPRDITLDMIQEPERQPFKELMEKREYL